MMATGITGAVVGMSPALAAVQRMGVFQVSRFSLLLDDHRVFQSMRVVKRIQLGLFDVPKGPGVVGRAHPQRRRYLFQMQSVHAPQHKSPFSMYFTPSKVSRMSMVNTLLIVMSFTFFSTAGVTRLVRHFGRLLQRVR